MTTAVEFVEFLQKEVGDNRVVIDMWTATDVDEVAASIDIELTDEEIDEVLNGLEGINNATLVRDLITETVTRRTPDVHEQETN